MDDKLEKYVYEIENNIVAKLAKIENEIKGLKTVTSNNSKSITESEANIKELADDVKSLADLQSDAFTHINKLILIVTQLNKKVDELDAIIKDAQSSSSQRSLDV